LVEPPVVQSSPTFVWKWLVRQCDKLLGRTRASLQVAASTARLSTATLCDIVISHTFEQGLSAAKSGDDRAAVRQFSLILQHDPRHIDSHIQRGLSFARLGQTEAALRDYSLAIELEPASADARRLRGIAFARQGHCIDALQDLNIAIHQQAQPLSICYRTRALVQLQLGDFRAALSDQAELRKLDREMLLVLTVKVAQNEAFVQLDTGENVPVEVGKLLTLLRAEEQRLQIELQVDDTRKTGWIHASLVKPSTRL
jgi:Flp pilus assembly protein TadD